jgi:hypothetical protein
MLTGFQAGVTKIGAAASGALYERLRPAAAATAATTAAADSAAAYAPPSSKLHTVQYIAQGVSTEGVLQRHARQLHVTVPATALDTMRSVILTLDDVLGKLPPSQVEKFRTFLAEEMVKNEELVKLCDSKHFPSPQAIEGCKNAFLAIQGIEGDEKVKKALYLTIREVFEHHYSEELRRPQIFLILQIAGSMLAAYLLQKPQRLEQGFTMGDLAKELLKIVQPWRDKLPDNVKSIIDKVETYLQPLQGIDGSALSSLKTRLNEWTVGLFSSDQIAVVVSGVLRRLNAGRTVTLFLKEVLLPKLNEVVTDAHENYLMRSIIRGFMPTFQDRIEVLEAAAVKDDPSSSTKEGEAISMLRNLLDTFLPLATAPTSLVSFSANAPYSAAMLTARREDIRQEVSRLQVTYEQTCAYSNYAWFQKLKNEPVKAIELSARCRLYTTKIKQMQDDVGRIEKMLQEPNSSSPRVVMSPPSKSLEEATFSNDKATHPFKPARNLQGVRPLPAPVLPPSIIATPAGFPQPEAAAAALPASLAIDGSAPVPPPTLAATTDPSSQQQQQQQPLPPVVADPPSSTSPPLVPEAASSWGARTLRRINPWGRS